MINNERNNRIISKYYNVSVPLRATLWFTVCNFMQRGVSMITTPIFTRLLPTEEYGIYSTYISWESVLLMVVSLCLYKGMMNLYVKYEDKNRVLSSICILELMLSGSWLIIGVIFRNQLAGLLKLPVALVICLFLYFISQAGFQCWSLHKRYIYEYRILVIITLLMTAGSTIVSVVAVSIFEATASVRAASSVIIMTLIGIYIYYLVFKQCKFVVDKEIWTFALGFCIPLMPHYLSEFILQSSDKIMINYMCGAHDVAIYSIAYAVGSLILLVTTSINSTFAPYQYQKMKKGEFNLLSQRANQIMIFVGVILCAVMLFSREIVLVFGGHKYEESIPIIIPICLGAYFNYMFQLFARVQEYYERKLTVVIPSLLCAGLNLLTNSIFIRIYGYQAAAYTTFGCYLFFCFVHYLFYRKVCKELLDGEQLFDTRTLFVISFAVIMSGYIISIINQYIYIKYFCVFALCLVIILMRDRLKKFIRTIVSKH